MEKLDNNQIEPVDFTKVKLNRIDLPKSENGNRDFLSEFGIVGGKAKPGIKY